VRARRPPVHHTRKNANKLYSLGISLYDMWDDYILVIVKLLHGGKYIEAMDVRPGRSPQEG